MVGMFLSPEIIIPGASLLHARSVQVGKEIISGEDADKPKQKQQQDMQAAEADAVLDVGVVLGSSNEELSQIIGHETVSIQHAFPVTFFWPNVVHCVHVCVCVCMCVCVCVFGGGVGGGRTLS
eukprot:COSAG05_NODE_6280_length_986_cov_1.315671_2_plen_122_part_01